MGAQGHHALLRHTHITRERERQAVWCAVCVCARCLVKGDARGGGDGCGGRWGRVEREGGGEGVGRTHGRHALQTRRTSGERGERQRGVCVVAARVRCRVIAVGVR